MGYRVFWHFPQRNQVVANTHNFALTTRNKPAQNIVLNLIDIKMSNRIYTDPVTGEPSNTPWTVELAQRVGRATYMDRNGCDKCGTKHPKTRYVNGNHCVGCLLSELTETFKLWSMGLPGRPEPFVTSEKAARDAGQDWYFDVAKSLLCTRGPHFRRTNVDTHECMECADDRERARATARGPRAMARGAGHREYQPDEACPDCGETAMRNVVTNKCLGACASDRRPGRPIGAAGTVAPREDARSTPTTIMISAAPADMVLSREDARAFGFTQYRTGQPCRRGHTGWRYVSVGNCVQCLRGGV